MDYIEKNLKHEVSELICLKCLNRWIGIYPEATLLKELECKCGEVGYVIKTGETIEIDVPTMKKYEITNDTKTINGVTVHRIVALKSFGNVTKGDLGGWIEKESNLSQSGNAWVTDDAVIYGEASVKGDAKVSGNAVVYDHALINCHANVTDNVIIRGRSFISGDTKVFENAVVEGYATTYDNAIIRGNARISGSVIMKGYSRAGGNVSVGIYE